MLLLTKSAAEKAGRNRLDHICSLTEDTDRLAAKGIKRHQLGLGADTQSEKTAEKRPIFKGTPQTDKHKR